MTADTLNGEVTGDINWDAVPDASEFSDAEHISTSRGTGRPRGRPKGSGGSKRGRPSMESRLSALQEKLSAEMFQFGALVGMPFHTTGYYICQESDNFTQALVELASSKKTWVEALEQVAMAQPALMVGRTVIGIGAALAVDREHLDPEKPFLKFLGVYGAWKKANVREGIDGEGISYQPPPTSFNPVPA